MKKCYVAIGGVGCRALKRFAKGNGDKTASYYYFDTDTRKSHEFESSDFRFVFDYPRINRQEHFDGKTPPIDERIQILCEKIKNILEC